MKPSVIIALIFAMVLFAIGYLFWNDLFEPEVDIEYRPYAFARTVDTSNVDQDEWRLQPQVRVLTDTEQRREAESAKLVGDIFEQIRIQSLEGGTNLFPWEDGLKSFFGQRFGIPTERLFIRVDASGKPILRETDDVEAAPPVDLVKLKETAEYLNELMAGYRAEIAERFDKDGDGKFSAAEAAEYAKETEEFIQNGGNLGEEIIDAYRRQIGL